MRHHPSNLPSFEKLRRLPWSTFGRRESESEFAKKWEEQNARAEFLESRLRFSLIVPISELVSETMLDETLWSLRAQSFPGWEAVFVLAQGCERLRQPLEERLAAEPDPRVRLVASTAQDPTELKNLGAEKSQGGWLGFIDPGAILSPVALFECAKELVRTTGTDVLYTNEAWLDDKARQPIRFLAKPEFSHFTLMHSNYIGRFWVVRKKFFQELGGLPKPAGIHAEHDFLLRAAERTLKFLFVPLYLYYRRGEGASGSENRAQTLKQVVQGHLKRTQVKAEVFIDRLGPLDRVRIEPKLQAPKQALISAFIPFRNRADWTLQAAKALEAQKQKAPLELIFIDNESNPRERAKIETMLPTFSVKAKLVDYRGPFNFGRMHNLAVRNHSSGQLLLFLNNDVFLEGTPCLDTWAAWALDPKVGTVGIQLRYGHGAVQHAGIRAFFGGEARLVRVGNAQNEDRFAMESHEVFANTFAACLVKRTLFDEVRGLRELDMANGFGDVAFNLECLRRGRRNLYLGHIQGTHLESASRGPAYEYWEECALEREYPELLQRMLRYDLGYNRVPGADHSISDFLREALKVKFRQNTPWLDPIKPPLKKLLRTLLEPGDNPVG